MVEKQVSLRRAAICLVASSLIFLIPTTSEFTPNVRFTAAIGLLMALLWMTEALPLGLTALVPLIAFPLGGINTMEKTAAPYANSAVFLFLGGFLLSAAFERSGLHHRVAYAALNHVGTEPRRLVLAVMIATALLSMWISNTATTLMMAPIAVAIVRSLGPRGERVAEATLLGVAYAASLGGIGTPIGTPPNIVFLGAARELFPDAKTISFAQWMGFGVFYLLVLIPICWFILIVASRVERGEAVSLEQLGLERPGTMSRAEKITVALCSATALLWIFRADIGIIPGWSDLFPNGRMINDATVAVAMAVLAFLLRLLTWGDFNKVPWDVLILFGGGFALAEALEVSGFSKWAGGRLSFIGHWPPLLMIMTLCLVVTLLSEVASNTTTATAMMPIAAALAMSIQVHPYMLMLPAALAASSGFMLPVATPPNTIVYGTGLVRVRAMTRAGFLLDLMAAIVITLLTFTVIPRVIGIDLGVPLPR